MNDHCIFLDDTEHEQPICFVSILWDQQTIQSEIGQDTMDEQSLLMVDNVLIYEDYVSSHG